MARRKKADKLADHGRDHDDEPKAKEDPRTREPVEAEPVPAADPPKDDPFDDDIGVVAVPAFPGTPAAHDRHFDEMAKRQRDEAFRQHGVDVDAVLAEAEPKLEPMPVSAAPTVPDPAKQPVEPATASAAVSIDVPAGEVGPGYTGKAAAKFNARQADALRRVAAGLQSQGFGNGHIDEAAQWVADRIADRMEGK